MPGKPTRREERKHVDEEDKCFTEELFSTDDKATQADETQTSKAKAAGAHGKDCPDQHVTTLYRCNRAQLAAHSVQGQVDAYRSYELNCPKALKAAEAEVMESGNCVVEVL